MLPHCWIISVLDAEFMKVLMFWQSIIEAIYLFLCIPEYNSMFVRWVSYSIQQKFHRHLHPIFLYYYTDCTWHIGMLFSNWYNRRLYHAYAYSVLSIFLAINKKCTACYVVINWRPSSMVENLRGEKFLRYQLQVHHLKGFQNAFHNLQSNEAPHGKEHLLHT